MPLLSEAIRASKNESARYRSDAGVSVLVERVIGQFVSDSAEGYAIGVQYDDARPAETYDAENLAATLDVLRSLRLPGFVPEADCWQPADASVEQWTHSL